MSFKRDGDDLSVLNMLKHQRVSNLLGDHIPEDEAQLLSNGRLTCTVCLRRPIFDTVAMLSKHRKGKKHMLELSRHLKRKEELETRKAIEMSRDLDSVKVEAVTGRSPAAVLGGGSSRSVLSERRKALEFQSPILQSSLITQLESVSPRAGVSQVRRYLRTIHRKKSFDKVIEEKRENFNKMSDYQKQDDANQSGSENQVKNVVLKEDLHQSKENINKLTQKSSTELNMNLSGWIKDKDGNWIKDPNAEFDSDDEHLSNPP